MTTAPNGELRRQDFHLQVQQLVSLRSLLWVQIERTQMPASALLTTPIILLIRTGGIVHPPLDLAINKIDIDTTADRAGLLPRGPQRERRAPIMPVGRTLRIPFCIIRFTPHKPERFCTHPHAREATLHRRTVERIECLKALRQAHLPQVGGPLGSRRLGHVGARLRWRHDFLIEVPLALFRERQLRTVAS